MIKGVDDINVLIISHNALAMENANAVVLSNLLYTFDKKHIAQIFIKNEEPSFFDESHFYRITDKDRLKGFCSKKTKGITSFQKNNSKERRKKRRSLASSILSTSSIAELIREFVWKYGKFNYDHLFNWVSGFNADVIVFVPGRSIFLNSLVERIASKFRLPVILFTSEDEYFHKKSKINAFHNILLKRLKSSYKNIITKYVNQMILIQSRLARLYYDEFGVDTTTIMMPSSQTRACGNSDNNLLLYAGNVDRGRVSTLVFLSKCLYNIDQKLVLTIVPGFATKRDLFLLKKQRNIRIIDFMPYDKYIEMLKNAHVIFNVDSFLKKYHKITTETFTGKTADLLRVGRPLCVIAPEYLYTYTYFLENSNSCLLISNLNELESKLPLILFNEDFRDSCSNNAYELSLKNHDLINNSLSFKTVVFKGYSQGYKNGQN